MECGRIRTRTAGLVSGLAPTHAGCLRYYGRVPVGGPGNQSEVELDRDHAAGLTHPGLNPDWQLRASTAFDDAGRLHRIEITMEGSANPDAWMRNTVEFVRFVQAATQIDLPDNRVHLAGYLSMASPRQ